MIHVDKKPEPSTFDANVRQKGLKFFIKKGIDPSSPLPPNTKLPTHWRDCLDDLHDSYQGTCAYLCVFIERVTGGMSVDHFIPKSKQPDLAYEWDNYRLACSTMNSRKGSYEDVLDPFKVEDGWFHLELITGHIFPNPDLPNETRIRIKKTIERLKLDEPRIRNIRTEYFQECCNGDYPWDYLKKRSPFVWYEAHRQGLQ